MRVYVCACAVQQELDNDVPAFAGARLSNAAKTGLLSAAAAAVLDNPIGSRRRRSGGSSATGAPDAASPASLQTVLQAAMQPILGGLASILPAAAPPPHAAPVQSMGFDAEALKALVMSGEFLNKLGNQEGTSMVQRAIQAMVLPLIQQAPPPPLQQQQPQQPQQRQESQQNQVDE